jgi:hypothetical protein
MSADLLDKEKLRDNLRARLLRSIRRALVLAFAGPISAALSRGWLIGLEHEGISSYAA